MLRWGISGCCLLFALFCAYGFIASGELDGASELYWKSGYAIAGSVALLTAVLLARAAETGKGDHE